MRQSRKYLLLSALLFLACVPINIMYYYYNNEVFGIALIQSLLFLTAGINFGFALGLSNKELDELKG